MRFSLIGTTQVVHDDGTATAPGGARLRALLTVLALRPGRPVTVGLIAAEIWDEEPPEDTPGAVQALVGRLRRAIGREAVESVAGGYRLRADADDVDLHRFDRLAGEGVRAFEAGDAAKAADLLDEALELWRGPVLADLPDRAAPAARWESRRLDARRTRLAAALALGRAEEALPELTALCADRPIDESLQALRLTALRALGRPAEALAAYEDFRRRLADELGTGPSAPLQTLHRTLLTAPAPPPAGPPPGPGGPRGAVPGVADAYGGPGRGPGGPGHERGAPAPGALSGAVPPGTAPGPGTAHGGPHGAVFPGEHGRGPDGSARQRDGVSGPEGSYGRSAAGDAHGGGYGPVSGGPSAAGGPDGGARGGVSGSDGWYGRSAAGDAHGGYGRMSGGPAAPADGGAGGPGEHGRDPAAGPVPARQAARGNLRARLTSFVGREADMETLRADLRGARLVTLLGPGGSGKTRLSVEVADRLADRTPDGVWMAELAPVDDPDAVAEAVLTALGARQTRLRGAGSEELRAAERHSDDPLDLLTEYCARRRMLLVLDNCEHLVAAAATLAERLLESCPGLTVLATSREPLGIPGELVRPVEPLPAPTALRLLAERGAQARPGFRVEDDPDACAEICRRLDGLPLAIELAAARLRMLAPRQIADRLDDRFRLLTSGSRTALPRQQTLRAVVDWSWELLDGPERAVLRRLSVFAGGCDLTAAEAVCAETAPDGAPGAQDIAELLGSLVDRSLVLAAPVGPGGAMRYRLLETVAEYASTRLDEAGDRPATERRHLVHYRELARTTDPLLRGAGQLAAIEVLGTEYENLRTALRRAVAARDEQEALCMVLGLAWYWHIRDLRAEGRYWTSQVTTLGPDPFALPLTVAPPVHERLLDAPPPMSPELLAEARRGVGLLQLVYMNVVVGQWTDDEHLVRLTRVAQVYRPGLPQTCRPPGFFWFFALVVSGDGDALLEMLDETVGACRRFGNEWELAYALQMRANVLANRSHWAGDAARDADEALAAFTRIGDLWGVAESLSARGEGHERAGRHRQAADDFTVAIGYAEEIGADFQAGVLRARLGGLLLELGEEERGEALLRGALAEYEGTANECTAVARIFLALWLGRTDRVAEARAMIVPLLDQFGSSSLAIFEGMVKGFLAWLDFLDGELEDSLARGREALDLARGPLATMVAPQLASVHLVTIAQTMTRMRPERAMDAARLLGASDARLPEEHLATSYECAAREASEAEVRAVLDDAAYDRAYTEGRALSAEEAADLI